MLLHFSEDPTVTIFHPRRNAAHPEQPAQVWAIDKEHVPLYYFPRDCPRVVFWPLPSSTADDRARFLGHTAAKWVAAVEGGWLDRIRHTQLYVYRLPSDSFVCVDPAGFYTSRETVVPTGVEPVGDLLGRLVDANVELRLTPSLWPLYHAVINSSLHFSIIRMRNARPEGASQVTP